MGFGTKTGAPEAPPYIAGALGWGVGNPGDGAPGGGVTPRPVIVVINKADCTQHIEIEEVHHMWPGAPFVVTSTLTGAGLPELEETIADLVLAGKTLHSASVLVTNVRHQEALRRAAEHLRASLIPLERRLPLDFVSIDLRVAYDALGEITGETASDDLLDRIFSEFCIGK